MHIRNTYHSDWIQCVENILNEGSCSKYWLNQNVLKSTNLANIVKHRLCDQFKQKWCTNVYESPKCLNYIIFKRKPCF